MRRRDVLTEVNFLLTWFDSHDAWPSTCSHCADFLLTLKETAKLVHVCSVSKTITPCPNVLVFMKEKKIKHSRQNINLSDTPVVGFHAQYFACNRFCSCRSRLHTFVWTMTVIFSVYVHPEELL